MTAIDTIVIRTSDVNVHAQLLDATRPNVAEFCRRHELELREFRGLKRGLWDWHSTFNRLYMFEELIAEGHRGWVIYLDADAFIEDLNFSIADYLNSNSERAGIVVHSGATPAYWDINSGVMLLNLGHPVACLIVRDWIQRHEDILQESEYLSAERPFYFGDQRILQHVLRDNPVWFDALRVETQDLMNSMHATFIKHHIRAMTPDFDRRLAMIRQDVDTVMRKFSAHR
jgi:hypothetical protein